MDNQINVLLTKEFFREDIEYIQNGLKPGIVIISPDNFSINALEQAVNGGIHVLLGSTVTRTMLEKGTDLKLIQIPWTGVDNLDFGLLNEFKVLVCNSHSNASVVSEYAVALMMSLIKNIPIHDRYLRNGKWLRPRKDQQDKFYPPESLDGKIIGFIGYGTIARRIRKMLSSFEVRIIAVDACQQIDTSLDFLGQTDQTDYVYRNADILFLTLPLTSTTRGMVNAEKFELMKSTAFLINVSRGEIVVEKDLYEALDSRTIAGAAIDTWYRYPSSAEPDVLPSSFPFQELDNIVMSPHRAGFSKGLFPHLDDAIENLNRLSDGQPLINTIDLNAGY